MSNTSKKSVDFTPKPVQTHSGHTDLVRGIAYLPGGNRLVTCSDDETIRIWDVDNDEEVGTPMLHDGWVRAVAVTRDGKNTISGGLDEVLKIWDVETYQLIEEWGGQAHILCIVLSPDDQLIAIGDGAGRIIVREMNLEGGQIIRHSIETVERDVNSIGFSPDGTKLASGHDDGSIRVFDVQDGSLILGPIDGHARHALSVVWSFDGSRFFTGTWDTPIRSWHSETGEAIGEPWTGHTHYVNCLALSPDGTKLASASGDNTVRFWDADSGDPIGVPLQHEQRVWTVVFSPSGEFVVSSEDAGGRVSIWRVPWWDNSKKEANKSLLDLPAIPHHTMINLDRHPDYPDLPNSRRPPPSRMHLRTSQATEDPARTRSSTSSWRLWRTLPRLLFGRSHLPPRRAELTTIYPGFGEQRVYVASRDGESTTESHTEPLPTTPGHYRTFSIMVESVSSTDSLDENQPTAAPPVDVQVSCCALFSRCRARSQGTTLAQPDVELTQRVSPTSNVPPPAVVPSSRPSTQNVMDPPTVAELPPGMA